MPTAGTAWACLPKRLAPSSSNNFQMVLGTKENASSDVAFSACLIFQRMGKLQKGGKLGARSLASI